MPKKVFLTVQTDTDRIPGTAVHYALVHDLDDHLLVSATLDYVLEVANSRGYVFVGENPNERQRIEQRMKRRYLRNLVESARLICGVEPSEYLKAESLLDRDWERDAELNSYENGLS